jgi:hypothetical protein
MKMDFFCHDQALHVRVVGLLQFISAAAASSVFDYLLSLVISPHRIDTIHTVKDEETFIFYIHSVSHTLRRISIYIAISSIR